MILLGSMYLGVEFWGHMTILCLILRNLKTFTQQLGHFRFPPAMHENFSFSTSWPTLIFLMGVSVMSLSTKIFKVAHVL